VNSRPPAVIPEKVAVGYEQERGFRELGETADTGYQVGVQRTLPVGVF
jgi:hypothetical protein